MTSRVCEINPDTSAIDRDHRKIQELTDVIHQYAPRFRRIALLHLGNVADAEDAVQDAVLSALAHVEQFRGTAKMSTWFTAIVINSARMKLRRRSAQAQIAWDETDRENNLSPVDFVSDSRPGPEEMYRKQEIAATLTYATARLSPILRKTFQLRVVNGLSIRETARTLGVPPGTVKARLARARTRLKVEVEKNLGCPKFSRPIRQRCKNQCTSGSAHANMTPPLLIRTYCRPSSS